MFSVTDFFVLVEACDEGYLPLLLSYNPVKLHDIKRNMKVTLIINYDTGYAFVITYMITKERDTNDCYKIHQQCYLSKYRKKQTILAIPVIKKS